MKYIFVRGYAGISENNFASKKFRLLCIYIYRLYVESGRKFRSRKLNFLVMRYLMK